MNNTASALLIVGIGYLYLVYHLDPIWTGLGLLLALANWLTTDREFKKLYKTYLELKIKVLEKKVKA